MRISVYTSMCVKILTFLHLFAYFGLFLVNILILNEYLSCCLRTHFVVHFYLAFVKEGLILLYIFTWPLSKEALSKRSVSNS